MPVAILRRIRSAFYRGISRERKWCGIAFIAIETIGDLYQRLCAIDDNKGNSIVKIRPKIGMEILLVLADSRDESIRTRKHWAFRNILIPGVICWEYRAAA